MRSNLAKERLERDAQSERYFVSERAETCLRYLHCTIQNDLASRSGRDIVYGDLLNDGLSGFLARSDIASHVH